MRFQVKNSDIFKLPGNGHMLHLGTIGYGLREFVVMLCVQGKAQGNLYIEETVLNSVDYSNDVFANFKFIEDDNLAADLAAYAEENNMTNVEEIANRLFSTGRGSWLTGMNVS